MRYNKIRKMDISNGPGVRVSIFVQGCTFNCKECFNPETHDFNAGKLFTQADMANLMDLCNKPYVKGLSILGGEPLHQNNIKCVADICKTFKHIYPYKTIWIWTGFKIENLLTRTDIDIVNELFNYIDVLVDGQFEIDKKDITLKYCGSSNQRVIDINNSNANNIVLYKD